MRNAQFDRQSNIELLRIVVMAMIVGGHFATHGGFQFNSQTITISRLWWNILEMGGNFGVDVFVLITGFFLIESKGLVIKPQKVIRIWGQIFFYSILLFFVSLLIGKGSVSPQSIIKTFFPITFGQWWFASTYLVLYLLHPYLNKLLQSLSKKEYQRLLLFMLAIWSIIPTFTTSSFQSNPLIEFVLYYSIAGYIKIYGLNHQYSSKTWFALWLTFSILTYLSCVIFMLMGKKIEFFSAHAIYFYGRNSILTICRAVSFFAAFLTLNIKTNHLINTISSAAFGVYLLHDSNLLRPYLWKEVFRNAQYQDSLLLLPYSIIVVAIVYIVCTIIDLMRKVFFEKPFMLLVNKYANTVLKPFSKLCDFFRNILFG